MLTIRIKGAQLTRDTQAIGSMSPYILVRNLQGAQIKRTMVNKGKNPIFQDSFSVPLGTPSLQFIVLDKQGGVLKKLDDVVGGGIWNCQEVANRQPGIPFQTIVPISYQGVEAGRVVLEVVAGGDGQGGAMQGIQQQGAGMQSGLYSGGMQSGMGFQSGMVGMGVGGGGSVLPPPPPGLMPMGSTMGAGQMGFSSGGSIRPGGPGGAPGPMATTIGRPVQSGFGPTIGGSQFASGAMIGGGGVGGNIISGGPRPISPTMSSRPPGPFPSNPISIPTTTSTIQNSILASNIQPMQPQPQFQPQQQLPPMPMPMTTSGLLQPGPIDSIQTTAILQNGPTVTTNVGLSIQQQGSGFGGAGAMGMGATGGTGVTAATAAAAATGAAIMNSSGAFGQAVQLDMAGRMSEMGRIRLEKVEHFPSYNLFSFLDQHQETAQFRIMPHKLRNY